MDDTYLKKVVTAAIFMALLVLSFFLLKPLLLSIVGAVILAFIFAPVYNWTYKIIKLKNLSVILICVLLAVVVITPFWFLTPVIINQAVKVYVFVQQIDFVTAARTIFPSFSEPFAAELGSIIHSFTTRMADSVVSYVTNLVLDFPSISLHFLVVLFTFYFVLRDKEQFISYIKSLLPFSKEVEKKLFDYTEGITRSVIYGQIIIGVVQGLVAGTGFLIFRVPNALLLILLSIVAGMLPVIGTTFVWFPVMIYLFVAGSNTAAVGILITGLISTKLDTILRPLIVSKRVQMHSSLVLVGMIGGLFMFGILGFILGPLILAYLLIMLEVYRNRKIQGVLIEPEKKGE